MKPSELTEEQRAALVRDSREIYREIWGEEVRDTHACLFHACSMQLLAFVRHEARFMLQAGSCSWPLVRPEDDDGVSATHYSYQWEGLNSPAVAMNLMRGTLPELHVWLAYHEPTTLVDPTTGTWPERARNGGLQWRSIDPPKFLWATALDLAQLSEERGFPVVYRADLHACRVADSMASEEIYPKVTNLLKSNQRRFK